MTEPLDTDFEALPARQTHDLEDVLLAGIDQFFRRMTADGLPPEQVQFFAGGMKFARDVLDAVSQQRIRAYAEFLDRERRESEDQAKESIRQGRVARSKTRRPGFAHDAIS